MKVNNAISARELWVYHNYRIIHGFRVAIAFIIMYLFLHLIDIPDSTWALITLVVVMGPISYVGNVFPRALQRVLGTIIGGASGIAALYIEEFSFTLMLVWCMATMFMCAYLALGKRPYVGILIGITLSVILGAQSGDFHTAMLRCGDVILGSGAALIFCSILPQRAFTHWRLSISDTLYQMSKMQHVQFSSNVIDRPDCKPQQKQIQSQISKLRIFMSPSISETRLSSSLFEAIQASLSHCLYTSDKLSDAYWLDRDGHYALMNIDGLKECRESIEATLDQLSVMMVDGAVLGDEFSFGQTDQAIDELKKLAIQRSIQGEASLYGYVWLNLQLVKEVSHLRRMVMLMLKLS